MLSTQEQRHPPLNPQSPTSIAKSAVSSQQSTRENKIQDSRSRGPHWRFKATSRLGFRLPLRIWLCHHHSPICCAISSFRVRSLNLLLSHYLLLRFRSKGKGRTEYIATCRTAHRREKIIGISAASARRPR